MDAGRAARGHRLPAMERLRDAAWVAFGLLLLVLLVGATVDVLQGVMVGGDPIALLPLLAAIPLGVWALRRVWWRTSWGRVHDPASCAAEEPPETEPESEPEPGPPPEEPSPVE